MRFDEVKDKLTDTVEFFTSKGEYIGFRKGEFAWAIAADEGYPAPDPDDVMAAEVVDRFKDEDGNDTFVVALA